MFIATVVVSVLFALTLLLSARGKLVKEPTQMKTLERVHFPAERVPLLAAVEIAGVLGILIGLAWWPLGAAAASGLLVYGVCAVSSHLRVRDRQISGAGLLTLVAAAALVLRLVSR